MRKIYLLLCAAILISGCSKDDSTADGTNTAMVNGVQWTPVVVASPSRFGRSDLFELDLYVNRNDPDEQYLGIGNVKKNFEKQKINYATYNNNQTPDNVWSMFITSQDVDVRVNLKFGIGLFGL